MEVMDVNIKPIYTQVAGVIVWLDLYGLSAWIVVKLDIYFRWEIYIYIYIYIYNIRGSVGYSDTRCGG